MIKTYLLFFLLILSTFHLSAQCPTGNVTLSSQTEVDNFVTAYSSCDALIGDLTIESITITDLSGLSFLTSIQGNLTITSNFELTNLTGLSGLETVGGNLLIIFNYQLTSITGLGQLTSVGGDVLIEGNDILETLDGLSQLASIGGSLTIQSNSALTTIAALGQIESIGGDLTISDNNLTSLTGLQQLSIVGNNLSIYNNIALTSLAGLQNLEEIGGNLTISDNTTLNSLVQLSKLTQIGGELNINSNEILSSLNGLEQLLTLGTGLFISYNDALTDCSAICDLINKIGVDGMVLIEENPSACSSVTEIATFCTDSDCPSGDVSLSTQNEVNAFIATFATCDSLPENLYITGDITDLSGLSFIEYVAGDLSIESNSTITDLAGLQNLKGVGGNISISDNPNLASITQFSQLSVINGALNISSNNALISLGGLANLTSIGTNLTIRDNGGLTDCSAICELVNAEGVVGTTSIYSNPSACSSPTEVATICTDADCPGGDVTLSTQIEVNAFVAAFATCDSLPGDLYIAGGNNITDLSGLSFIQYVEGDLTLINNYSITDLAGFENLKKVAGSLKIDQNRNLDSLSQLSQLLLVGGDLSVQDNDSLKTLRGFEQLNSVGGDIYIRYNANLGDCSGFCDLLSSENIGGTIQISNNPSECSSVEEVQSLCTYGSLLSTIFIQNLPTTIEEGEPLVFNVAVDFAPNESILVNISSSNPTEVPISTPVTIPGGMTSVEVSMMIPNDTIPEQEESITITAGATFLSSASRSFTLTDNNDIPAITFELVQDTVAETAGNYAIQGIVRRVNDAIAASVLEVTVASSQNLALYLPEKVSLDIGEQEKSFFIGVLDNDQVDGYRTMNITAQVLMASCNCAAPTNSEGVQTEQFVVIDNDGPALTLLASPLSLAEGLANAGTLTIQRNTDTAEALEVELSVSDDSELSVPATVTIPQGAASVLVPITTIADPIMDGNQQVSVQANATNFSPGIVWVIVTDINKPDLQVADVRLLEDNVTSLEQFPFRVFVTNTGFATVPSGVKLTGYLSDDNFVDDNDFEVGEYIVDVAIPVGDTLEIANLGISPSQPQNYTLLFQVNSDDAITELLYLNNTSAPTPLLVLPSYVGSAIVDDSIFVQGASIPVYGTSTKSDGTLVPNADLEIYITNGDLRREIVVRTDEAGQYTTIFKPLASESGHYTIGASFPGQKRAVVQDKFDILGVKVNNGEYFLLEVMLNDTLRSSLPLTNTSHQDLSQLTIEPLFLPPGCSLSFDTLPFLEAGSTLSVNYEISGSEITSIEEYIPILLQISNADTSFQITKSYYFCQAQTAHLKADISSINTTFNQNQSRLFEFKIFNEGMAETADITVDFPQVDWLKVVSGKIMPSMESGDTSVVTLEFIPALSLPLNTPARGNIVVNAANGNYLNIPFTLEKVSEATGDIIVDVIDQYTYFTEEAPHLANASVKISHYFTGEVYAEGKSNEQGLFMASNLPEGQLRIVVEAEKHQSYDGLIYIAPGRTEEKVIFLQYQAISFSWDVVPTTIDDEYEVNLVMEFETNVPVPVVIIDMPKTMPQLLGDATYPFFVNLTNKGLITANDVQLSFSEDSEYEFITNYTPQDLLAQQAIQIPVVMRRQGNNSKESRVGNTLENVSRLLGINPLNASNRNSSSDGCVGITGVLYGYVCGENGMYENSATSFTVEGERCPFTPPEEYRKPLFPSGIGIFGQCQGCVDRGGITPTAENIGCKCNDCLKNVALSAFSCSKSAAGAFATAASCAINPDVLNCIPLVRCLKGLGETITQCFSGGGGGGGGDGFSTSVSSYRSGEDIPLILQPHLSHLDMAIEALDAKTNLIKTYFGDLFDNDNFIELANIVNDVLINEQSISDDERAYILAEMASFDMDRQAIIDFIERWNTTIQAWEEGILSPTQTYSNIIDKNQLDSYQATINEVLVYTSSNGFKGLTEMIEVSVSEIMKLTEVSADPNEETAFNPVCASVSINISQTLTMTREAFEGTLTIYNGHPTDDLEKLSLNLELLDENGVNSNDLFEIETKEVNTLTAIDGTGTLVADKKGYAKIVFIPEKGAAPNTPRSYSFGGSISYLDPFTGLMVTMPLIPVTLQVNPSPDLFLHYFMQRDILGDDPLTIPIEPIVPADLAVMIENNGFGLAQNVVIASAQPKIVENEKGLAINFNLIGSNLQGQAANLGLNTIDFGKIEAKSTRIGQWYFTSDLLGHFDSYETNLVHSDSRGNPKLSLVSGATLHELIHTISVYGTVDDKIDDFLVNEIADGADAPDAIYLSQGNLVYDVYTATSGQFTGDIYAESHTTILEFDPLGIGWNYLKVDDPGYGLFKIVSVTRNNDSQEIPLKNVWLSHVRIPDGGAPIYDKEFHFVDDFASGDPVTYTVVWSPLDPNPPMVDSIAGHPTQATSEQVSMLRVTFSKAIDPTSFTHEDLMLKFQGGDNIIDASVSITPIDSTTFEIDLSSLTIGNGYYTFTVQAAGVKDLTGTSGEEGKQVSWTQFLSLPVIKEFIGLPDDFIGNAFDTVQLLFNLPIEINSLTTDKFSISKDEVAQSGTLLITPIDEDSRLFKLEGLGSFMSTDGEYVLTIDLPNIQTTDNMSGLATQSITLTLDTQVPMLTNMVQISEGGLDQQHYTGMTLNFNEAIQPLNSMDLVVKRNGIVLNTSDISIKKKSPTWYEVKWPNSLSYPEGIYDFTIDMSKVVDLAGNAGVSTATQNWTVDRSPDLMISNMAISPDLGYSSTDGITSKKSLSLSFNINEIARDIEVYQNDNGTLSLLNSLSSANAGTVNLPLVFETGGHTAITILLTDLQGNLIQADQDIYIDETVVDANWQFNTNQQLIAHPTALVVEFSERILDVTTLPSDALSFSFNNNVLEVASWTFTKATDTTYTLRHLSNLGTAPGIYKIGLDLSYFQKYSSGITGNDVIYVSWELLDPNNPPVALAGSDSTILIPTNYVLNASQSYDPDADALSYRWYPPTGLTLNDSSLARPSFAITKEEQGKAYTFVVSVSDGKKNSTDMVRVNVAIDEVLPTASCKVAATAVLDENGQVNITVSDLDENSSDNLGIDTMFLNEYNFDCADIGIQMVTLNVVDVAENTATCQVPVTISDDNVLGDNERIDGDPIPAQTYIYTNTITSAGSVAANTAVTFKAGSSITLRPNFHAKNGSEFLAIIEDCAARVQQVTDTPSSEVAFRPILSTPAIENSAMEVRIIPNPFATTTTIDFVLPQIETLDITIHDITGRLIKQLASKQIFEEGKHQLTFDAAGNLPGMYLLMVKTEREQIVRKMMLIKG